MMGELGDERDQPDGDERVDHSEQAERAAMIVAPHQPLPPQAYAQAEQHVGHVSRVRPAHVRPRNTLLYHGAPLLSARPGAARGHRSPVCMPASVS